MNFINCFAFLSIVALAVTGCTEGLKLRRFTSEPKPVTPLVPKAPTTEFTKLNSRPAAKLRKLSLHLRGRTPELSEYEELAKIKKEAEVAPFLAAKTKEYLADPHHFGKLIDRLDELFRLKVASGLPETRLLAPNGVDQANVLPGSETLNSMDLLFEDLARNNRSWDTLISSKSYTVPVLPMSPSGVTSLDEKFFSEIAAITPPSPPKPGAVSYANISFDAKDPRIAGAITTGRFFSRYSTTNINRSRGRAAALFRVFLCDEMRAVVTGGPGEDEDLLKKAFPKDPPPPDAIHAKIVIEDDVDKHATDPACAACHYKLDPMGKGFLTIGEVISENASPGALVFRRADNTLVNHPGEGLGEVAAAILTQPEYAQCQVSHFWKWFIRGDEMPSPSRMAELVDAFNKVGRRTNDYIAYLVSQPEFYNADSTVEHATLTQVRPLLQRCDACHSGTSSGLPSFTKFPIAESSHASWLEKITKQLDLAHQGAKKTMPPEISAWQPSKEDLALLGRWIAEGARDDDGKVTVDPQTTKEWLKP